MPKYEHHIFVCENARPEDHPRGSCDSGGRESLRDRFKQEVRARGLRSTVRANRAGCLDQCEHGPVVVVYPEAVWYGRVTLDDVAEILDKHIAASHPVERLLIADGCLNNPDCPHRVKRADPPRSAAASAAASAASKQEERHDVKD